MQDTKSNTCQQAQTKREIMQLSGEEWEEIASLIGGLCKMVEKELVDSSDRELIDELRRVADCAQGGLLWISQFAAEKCSFTIVRGEGNDVVS